METNKAMNEELKSAEESTRELAQKSFKKYCQSNEGDAIAWHFWKRAYDCAFVDFQKQLKEKEEEIEMLNSELKRKFIEWGNQKQTIKNYQEVVTRHFPDVYACSENLDEELTKSNEMNEMLAVEFAEWILKNYTSEYYPSQGWVWERVDTILPPSKTTKELLNEYQNPKK